MTAFPALVKPFGTRRILRVDVEQNMRADLKLVRTFINRHVQHAWEIPWSTLSGVDRTTLDDFFKTVRGRGGDVSFTDPFDSVAYTGLRCDHDAMKYSEGEPTRWESDIRLLEISGFQALKTPVTAFPALSSGAVVQLPYTMERRYHTEIVQQQDDAEKRYENFADANGLQRWAVGGDSLTDAEATTLIECWEGNNGPYRAMTFTEPETSTAFGAVHFIENELVHILHEFNSNEIRLTLEELRT